MASRMLKRLFQKLKDKFDDWYGYKYVQPDRDEDSGVVFIGHFERHWTADAVSAVLKFIEAEWKWIITTLLAIIAILVALPTGK